MHMTGQSWRLRRAKQPRPQGADLWPTLRNPPKLHTPIKAAIVPAPPIDPMDRTPPMLPMLKIEPTDPAAIHGLVVHHVYVHSP